jgi:hypothetical protein
VILVTSVKTVNIHQYNDNHLITGIEPILATRCTLNIAQTVGDVLHNSGMVNQPLSQTFAENYSEVTSSNMTVIICSHW